MRRIIATIVNSISFTAFIFAQTANETGTPLLAITPQKNMTLPYKLVDSTGCKGYSILWN